MEWNEFLLSSGRVALRAVFPENIYCVCCGDVLDPGRKAGLCLRCEENMPWALDNPYRSYMDEFAFDDVWPCVRYGSQARKIMNALKNGGRAYIAKNIGRMLAERVQLEWTMPDLFVAVPSHKSKMRARGYNQAELLAKETAELLKLPYQRGLLLKTQATGSMRMADGLARRSMLEGSIAVSPQFTELVRGRFLCLVDDVTTTGSTADACARILKDAGASRVALLCFGASSGIRADALDGREEDGPENI